MKFPVFFSVVIYLRNEAENVKLVLPKIDQFLARTFDLYEIVLVDDASTDDLESAIASVAPKLSGPLTVLQLARPHGVEAAIIAGLERAMGDFVAELETLAFDFEIDLLATLYERAAKGFDVVAASGGKPERRSRLFYWMVNRYSNLGVDLATERVRIVSRRALNAMLALKEKVRYRKALYALTGFPSTRVSYRPTTTRRETPRHLNRETITLAFDVMVSFSNVGLRLAHLMSFVFGFFSCLVILYVIMVRLVLGNIVSGWTSLMAFLAAGLAGLFFILGVIGEYLARILIEVRSRPLYALRESRTIQADSGPASVTKVDEDGAEGPHSFFRSQLEQEWRTGPPS